jgi:hypothetical protein
MPVLGRLLERKKVIRIASYPNIAMRITYRSSQGPPDLGVQLDKTYHTRKIEQGLSEKGHNSRLHSRGFVREGL